MVATRTRTSQLPAHRPGDAHPLAPRTPPSPAPLQVVPHDYLSPAARRRRARAATAVGVFLACVVLFGLAGIHVVLTEGQFRLQHLQRQADDAQAHYVRLRLQVAELESPDRIVASAQERLGMVTPASVTYLVPQRPPTPPPRPARATPPTMTPGAPQHPADTTRGWAASKPVLASRP